MWRSHSPIDFVATDEELRFIPEVRSKKSVTVTVEVGYDELREDGWAEDDLVEDGEPAVLLYPRR